MKKTSLLCYALLFILFACSEGQKSVEKYFDFDGLLDDQISQLSQRAVVLDKIADMNGDKSDTTFLPSAKGWESEFEIFRQLESINKPTYRGIYKIVDQLEDPMSNLKVRQFAAPDTPVPVIKFYYQDEFSNLRKIEATFSEKNLLYSTQRMMMLEFEDDDDKPLLFRYSMSGFQKTPLRDTVKFFVLGEIDW